MEKLGFFPSSFSDRSSPWLISSPFIPHLNPALWHYTFMLVHVQKHTFLRLALRQGARKGWCTLSSLTQVKIRSSGESLDCTHTTNRHQAVQISTHTVRQHDSTVTVAIFWLRKLLFFPSDVIGLLLCRPPISSLNKTIVPAIFWELASGDASCLLRKI